MLKGFYFVDVISKNRNEKENKLFFCFVEKYLNLRGKNSFLKHLIWKFFDLRALFLLLKK